MPVTRRGTQRLLLVCVVAGTVPVLGTQQPASAELYFKAVGRADGMRLVASGGDALPLGAAVEVGLPTAAVTLSTQSSGGFASAPYPGPVVQGALGLVASSGGPQATYPALVESRHPGTPSAETSTGPYVLKARSTAIGSSAEAKADSSQPGVAPASTTARATAAASGGAVTVEAVGLVQSLEVAGVLRLGRVESRVTIERGADGRLVRSSRLVVEGATVAGQSVSVGPEGVTAGSQGVPVEETPLQGILAGNGITITYLPSSKVDSSSMTGAGLRIDVVQDTPAARLSTVYTLGRSFASLTSYDDSPPAGPSDGPPTVTSPPAPGSAPVTTGSTDASVGTSVPVPPLPAPVTAGAEPGPVAAVQLGEAALFGDLASAFGYWYLALVAAACATVTSGVALRVLGVRQPSGARR